MTIYDVAKKAGVGIGTVSRAFNNSSQIREETKQRILKIANELNYQPHGLARGLARKQTHTISTVVPFFFNYFFLNLLRNVQYSLANNNYDMFLYSITEPSAKEAVFDRVLYERKSDGVMIFSLELDKDYADKFIESKIPVIIVDHFHPTLDSVTISNRRGAREAVQHLITLGHRDIAIINGSLSSFPARARLKGYKEALRSNKIDINPDYIFCADSSIGEDGFNEEAGYREFNRLADLGSKRPTAVFISSDIQAIGAMRAAKENNIKIPKNMAIVGFDDIDFAKYVGLTTMRQPVNTMTELAVNRLLQKIDKKATDKFQIELNAELIIRESCGGHVKHGAKSLSLL